MKPTNLSYDWTELDNYYLVLFTVDGIKFYALVDKETSEPFRIASLHQGNLDTFAFNAEDDYKIMSNGLSVSYFDVYDEIKAYFQSFK